MKFKKYFIIFVLIVVLSTLYYSFFYDNFSPVIKGKIYRSAQLSGPELQKIIKKYRIRTIINLRGAEKNENWYEIESEIANKNNLKLVNIKFSAYTLPLCANLDALIDTFLNAEKPILLHCYGGADRSGMASALALAIGKDPPLSVLKNQFSLRYGVIRFNSSIGPLLFAQYENWLRRSGSYHNRDTLLYWIKNFYVDNKGNIEFVIDVASGIKFKAKGEGKKRVVTLSQLPKTISIHGWAFDRRRNTHIAELSVVIPNHVSKNADLGIIRPDVAEVFDLKREAFPDFKVGWGAVFDSSALPEGCYDIFLKIRIKGGEPRRVATDCRLCI